MQHFISGMEIHTDYYQLMARLDAQSEQERIANNAWGQGITEWINRKDKEKQYPVLDGYRCTGISVSTPFYMGGDGYFQRSLSNDNRYRICKGE